MWRGLLLFVGSVSWLIVAPELASSQEVPAASPATSEQGQGQAAMLAAFQEPSPSASGSSYSFPILGFRPLARDAGPFASRGDGSVPLGRLLPVPTDPGNMLMPDAPAPSTLSLGFGVPAFNLPAFRDGAAAEAGMEPVVMLRTSVLADLDVMYDTGYQESFSPSTIALRGTSDARKSGRVNLSKSLANLTSDVQVPSDNVGAQGYLDLDFYEEGVRVRQAFGRVGNLLAGEYWSTFGDWAALPRSIIKDKAPAGAIYRPSQALLQYAWTWESGWSIGGAIEQPTTSDFSLIQSTDVRLQRWPDLVVRLQRQHPDEWGGSQLAVLVRSMGVEDEHHVEHFATGWGVSGTTRFRTWGNDNLRLGAVGGEGIGSYIFGLNAYQCAAAPEAGHLRTLPNYGAFIGYQNYWTSTIWSNYVYGYALVDPLPGMPATATRQTQNAWVDLIWNVKTGVAFGLEYGYGTREARDHSYGDNHQVQVSLQIGTPAVPQPKAEEPAVSRSLNL